jgi:glucose/arabinose dehydrogenase
MVLDGKGGVYVTDYMPGNVVRVNLENGQRGIVCEGLNKPEGIAMAYDGRLLVAETGTQSVVSIDAASGARSVIASGIPMGLTLTTQLPPMGVPTGVAASADGALFVSADLTDSIWKISKQN